jgi:hypothetical protein
VLYCSKPVIHVCTSIVQAALLCIPCLAWTRALLLRYIQVHFAHVRFRYDNWNFRLNFKTYICNYICRIFVYFTFISKIIIK